MNKIKIYPGFKKKFHHCLMNLIIHKIFITIVEFIFFVLFYFIDNNIQQTTFDKKSLIILKYFFKKININKF